MYNPQSFISQQMRWAEPTQWSRIEPESHHNYCVRWAWTSDAKDKNNSFTFNLPSHFQEKSFQRRKSWLTESLQNNLCLVIVYFLDVSSKSCVEGLEPKVGSKTFRRWGLIGKSCVPEDIPLKGKLRPWHAYLLSLFSSLPQPRPLSLRQTSLVHQVLLSRCTASTQKQKQLS